MLQKQKIDTPYYSDFSRINNSSIGIFLSKGPRALKDTMNGKGEILNTPQLERGTMIHEYILQPDEFWKDYTILDYEVPKVKQQKDFCDAYVSSLELLEDEKLLKAYRSSYNNQKSSEIALNEARELFKRYEKYIEAKRSEQDGKKPISFADLDMLKKIKQNLQEHQAANKLLFDVPTTYDCENEFHINWEAMLPDGNVKCKSLLDRLMIDNVNKKIILIDLKTTSNVYDFKHSVESFDYYRQLAFYIFAITWYMLNICNLNIDNYDLEVYIIAIQTNGSYEVRVFNMFNEEELLNRRNIITDALKEISYHLKTNNWEHTRAYYESEGIEELDG